MVCAGSNLRVGTSFQATEISVGTREGWVGAVDWPLAHPGEDLVPESPLQSQEGRCWCSSESTHDCSSGEWWQQAPADDGLRWRQANDEANASKRWWHTVNKTASDTQDGKRCNDEQSLLRCVSDVQQRRCNVQRACCSHWRAVTTKVDAATSHLLHVPRPPPATEHFANGADACPHGSTRRSSQRCLCIALEPWHQLQQWLRTSRSISTQFQRSSVVLFQQRIHAHDALRSRRLRHCFRARVRSFHFRSDLVTSSPSRLKSTTVRKWRTNTVNAHRHWHQLELMARDMLENAVRSQQLDCGRDADRSFPEFPPLVRGGAPKLPANEWETKAVGQNSVQNCETIRRFTTTRLHPIQWNRNRITYRVLVTYYGDCFRPIRNELSYHFHNLNTYRLRPKIQKCLPENSLTVFL